LDVYPKDSCLTGEGKDQAMTRIMNLLTVLHKLNDTQHFAEFSELLVLHWIGSILVLKQKHDSEDFFPLSFYSTSSDKLFDISTLTRNLVELDRLRATAQRILMKTMYEIVDPLGEEYHGEISRREGGHFFYSLRNKELRYDELFAHVHYEDDGGGFTPALKSFAIMSGFHILKVFPPDFNRTSIADILKRLKNFDEEYTMELFGKPLRKEMYPCDYCEEEPVEKSIEEMDKKVRAAATGVCLECLKANRDMSKRRECCPK
jgi:hypothetical protein